MGGTGAAKQSLPCPSCGGPMPPYVGVGRPRRFCQHSCRQAAYFGRNGIGSGGRAASEERPPPVPTAPPPDSPDRNCAEVVQERDRMRKLLGRCDIAPGPLPTPCVRVPVRTAQWNPRASTTLYQLAYRYWIGPIPTGLFLDHLCQDGTCVAADHLEPVTPRENSRRTAERARLGAAAWLADRVAPKSLPV